MGRRLIYAAGVILTALVGSSPAWGKNGVAFQAALGNPDGAATDPANRTKFLIERPEYVISYNDETRQANWVSWSYSLSDSGSQARTDAWAVEELLPPGFLRIPINSFGTQLGQSWDRGHMTPSADRTLNFSNNAVTFRMSNIIPQASQNNQGLWNNFEAYCRSLAADGSEVLLIAGPGEFDKDGDAQIDARLSNQMGVGGKVWKIAVVVPNANSTIPANQRITTSARVIALITPNVGSGLLPWQSYITSVEAIEDLTGLNFFTAIPDPNVAIYLKNVVDTGTAPNNPTVITTFNPTLGSAGTPVVINGFNFGNNPAVAFNGAPATVTAVSSNSITVTVPPEATSGVITVTGTGGTDTSYEPFTVAASTSPLISVSTTSLSGLVATQGSAGQAVIYSVTGVFLNGTLTVDAPSNFEISKDGVNFAARQTFEPDINGAVGGQIHVRITAGAPAHGVSGTITHFGSGAATRNVSVSGTVASTSPFLATSAASVANLFAVQGSPGASKSYTVNGGNLTGNILLSASAGFEISLNNTNFAPTQTLVPSAGALTGSAVFVRIANSAAPGAVSGTIQHTGGGAEARTVTLTGTVNSAGTGESWIATSGANTKGSINTGQSFSGKSGVWINEFHYDTSGTDVGEFVEIVVGPDVTAALVDIVLYLYNGSGGATYESHTLSTFTLGGTMGGYRIFHKDIPNIQNGAPDGFSVTVAGTAVQFLSYEGFFTATSGPAIGLTSQDIGVFESGAPANSSLQLIGSFSPPPPTPPVISSPTSATATAYELFNYLITASNTPNSFEAAGLPDGLSVNPTNGAITGMPVTPGTYNVELSAANAGGEDTEVLSLTVLRNPGAPDINSPLSATGQIGVLFNYQITASNTPNAFVATGLPAGLEIDAVTGAIRGTPVAPGSTSVTITAANAVGSDTRTLVITVLEPNITLNPAVLSAFAADLGQASTEQSYAVTGTQLSEPITVTAPPNFEIRLNGGQPENPIVLVPDGSGNVSANIRVRMSASAPLGVNAGTIVHAGSAATPKYLEVTGTVDAPDPTLSLSAAILSGFSTKVGTASFTQSYTVTGANLTSHVAVTAPTGYEISLDGNTFSPTLTLSPVSGSLSAVEIDVRLSAPTPTGTYAGNITHIGGGATQQDVALTGQVTSPNGPPITSLLGGSIYAGGTFNYTITAGGDSAITGYGASDLPTGLSINTSTGVISGTVAAAGSYPFTITASNAEGASSATYSLRVMSSAEQNAIPLSVAVNKYQNSSIDRIELLVIGDTTDAAPGPPVDMRGMTIKDFNGNMASDFGGKYLFTDNTLWSSVRAGTLIVLSAGSSAEEDTDAGDFVLRINLGNPAFFLTASAGFDIGNTDMVMIKAAGTGPAGVAGGIHALAAGNAGTQYNTFAGRRLRASSLSSNRTFAFVENNRATAADFSSSTDGTANTARSLTFGAANNDSNGTFIQSRRALDQTPPAVTLIGASTVTVSKGGTFTDPGATATGTTSPVTVSGTVDTSSPGTYVLTYSASDTAGNVGTAQRTIIVQAGRNILASGSIPALGAVYGSASATASFTVGGENLSQAITITAPAGFEMSTNTAGPFFTSLQIGAAGNLTPTGIHVRLAPGTPAGQYAGEITLVSNEAASKSIAVASSLVTLRPLAVAGLSGLDRIYNGTALAPIAGTPTLSGLVPGDEDSVVLGGEPNFVFADAAAGTNKPIIVAGFAISGAKASNYMLMQPEGLVANIAPADLSGVAVAFSSSEGGGFTASADGVTGFDYAYRGRNGTIYNSSANPTAPGFYTVEATSTDPNFQGSASFDFIVSGPLPADDTRNVALGAATVEIPAADLLANDLRIDGNGSLVGTGLTVTAVQSAGDIAVLADGIITVTLGSAGTHTFNYTVSDGSKSATASVTLTATDQTAPVIVLNGEETIKIPLGRAFSDPGATAEDNVDPSVSVVVEGTVGNNTTGTYQLVYRATDSSGNSSQAMRTVVVMTATAYYLEAMHGLTGQAATLSADPDNDGWSNAQEFAFGQNPTSSQPSLLSMNHSGNELTMTFLAHKGATYSVKSSTDLPSGFTGTVAANIATNQSGKPSEDYTRFEAKMTTDDKRGFLCVEATLPPEK